MSVSILAYLVNYYRKVQDYQLNPKITCPRNHSKLSIQQKSVTKGCNSKIWERGRIRLN